MRVSKSCEHGLRAILSLVSLGEGIYVPIHRLSRELNISSPTLTKILQRLSKAALLKSKRGPTGGVALARDPDTITLYDVVVAIDGSGVFGECMLGLSSCGTAVRCPMEEHWAVSCKELALVLRQTSLVDAITAPLLSDAD